MKIYTSKNVYEAALERIEFIYNEFPNVCVSVSGGKDSTVVMHLAIEVARKLKRLPVTAFFVDQEAEWLQTIEYMRIIQAMPEVDLKWYQIESILFNATSHSEEWLYCWRDGDKWMRDKEENSIKENIFGVNRFKEILSAYLTASYPGEKACSLGGVRCQESPARYLGLTTAAKYKHITYGAKHAGEEKYRFYPIYDWEISDVWKYINSNNLPYNKVYDLMYQKGVQPTKMRVSSLVHEIAINKLKDVQDIDGKTWDSLVEKLDSANSIKHLKSDGVFCPDKLPFMFGSWREYRDYLLEKLVVSEDVRDRMRHRFTQEDCLYVGTEVEEQLYKVEITTIIKNDYYFTALGNFTTNTNCLAIREKRRVLRGGNSNAEKKNTD